MSSIDTLVTKLTQLFHDELNLEIAGADQDLIDEGMLDSLSLVEMLLLLEQEFGVEISILDIDFDSFRTVRNIATFVAGVLGPDAPAAAQAGAETAPAIEPEPA